MPGCPVMTMEGAIGGFQLAPKWESGLGWLHTSL
jgi:hypothetical protein